MIRSVDTFTKYFDGIRRRTTKYIQAIPGDQVDWSPKAGELTCSDIVRHLAAAEKMFVGATVNGRWHYLGHNQNLVSSLDEVMAHLESCHAEAMSTLHTLNDEDLYQPRPTLNGPPVKAWRLLMAIVEHEVHHRSQLAVYLALLGSTPPQIYGLEIDEVIALSGKMGE